MRGVLVLVAAAIAAAPITAEAPKLVPLVRLAVKRDITARELVRTEADIVASYRSGRLHALIEIGGIAELSLDDKRESWAVVGPNLAWTHGRIWLSAAFGIGIYQIDTAPRFTWGIMS